MNERVRTLMTFLAADPADLFSRYALAMEYRKVGLLTECATELQKVLYFDADYIGAYYQLGSVLTQLGDTSQALVTYKTGIERAEKLGDWLSAKEMQEALAMMELEHE